SSCIDRFISTDDSELNIKSLIENLKNMIMKKLSVLYVARSSVFLSVSSAAVSFSATLSQSSTPVSVSGSSASAISVSVILTLTTSALSGFTVSAFIISSSHFKKILCRLNESYLSVYTLLSFLLTSRTIYCIKT
ncbi:hypothetical protein BDFG_09257, partial [Blastomyces dermatitidis ATCC 26199]